VNRQQRRSKHKTKTVHNHSATPPTVNPNQLINKVTQQVVASFVVTLHDKFGFGKKRLQKLLREVDNQFQCVSFGQVSLDDLIKICKEEIGVENL
jgi:predicted nucleic acid-binding protein